MASIRKRGDFQYQARILRDGFPAPSKPFNTKPEAEVWRRAIESEMDRGIFVSRVESERTTLCDALKRYVKEVTVNKRGKLQESSLIERWKKHPLALRPLATL